MTTPSANLDFDSIKRDLITAIKSDPTFTDYNFEGSALNALVDILANNTFNNAFLASAAHAENFLDSAQRRSSVVSRATEMGYTPVSAVCSTAYIDVTALNLSTSELLPRGLIFTSTNENGTYNFSVVDDVSSTTNGVNQEFKNVKIVEGVLSSNRFTVDTSTNIRSIFTIPNIGIDTSTLRVFVRDSINSVDRVEYTLADVEYGLTGADTVFFLQESYSGFFQIYFGNNVIGKQPSAGSIIEVTYFLTKNYDKPNGCRLFAFDGSIGTASSVSVSTTQIALGGDVKESIDSIKLNAKKSNSAKQRYVKESDYELALKENFGFIKAVSVWGGEKNIPPVYGKVFFSIQPKSGFTISDTVKRDVLTPAIRKNAVINVIPEFVDPVYLLVEFTTLVKFNQSKTITTRLAIKSNVQSEIADYISSISTFNTDYINSQLIKRITNLDPGLVGVSVSKRVGFRLTPLIAVKTFYNRSIYNSIKADTINSTKFQVLHNGVSTPVVIKEVLGSDVLLNVKGVIQTVKTLAVFNSTGENLFTIGTVNLSTGKFEFYIDILSYSTSNRFVQISCELNSQDIISTQNQIIILDSSVSEDTVIGLSTNNYVDIENYDR
jgi:hypothetical protein